MSTASVSLSRSTTALVIADDGATYRLTDRGISRPSISWRLTAAPDSVDIHGTEYIAAAKEQSALPLEVMVTAASSSALKTAADALEAALSQFAYTATVVVDGVSQVWSCAPASWASGLVDSGEVAAHMCTYTITIPVYPVSA